MHDVRALLPYTQYSSTKSKGYFKSAGWIHLNRVASQALSCERNLLQMFESVLIFKWCLWSFYPNQNCVIKNYKSIKVTLCCVSVSLLMAHFYFFCAASLYYVTWEFFLLLKNRWELFFSTIMLMTAATIALQDLPSSGHNMTFFTTSLAFSLTNGSQLRGRKFWWS